MKLGDDTYFKRMQTQEEVDAWFADIEREIDVFMSVVPADLREQLDYSTGSIDKLEAWLLGQYSKVFDAYNAEGLVRLAGAGCYVGELVRKLTGADWYVELQRQEHVFLGIPVLRKSFETPGGRFDTGWCYPFSLVTASFGRRTGVFIRDVAEKFIRAVGVVDEVDD